MKAHPSLFEGEEGSQKNEGQFYSSLYNAHTHSKHSQNTFSQIFQKRFEIERKCEYKLDMKLCYLCLGVRMARIFLTSRDF